MTEKAVILARGLGTRMRRADASADLTAEEAAVAATGVKAMMPIGRPFLDYVLSALADAGIRRVCLVIGPEHEQVRRYYGALASRRVEVSFAVQPAPRGTADAVAAGEQFAAGDDVLVLNSDNYYPVEAFSALRALDGPGLAAFTPEGLCRGNIPPERIARFALVEADPAGRLARIVEKPTEADLARAGSAAGISMNCWRLGACIYEACRAIGPSPRGEWELPDAVEYSMRRLGASYRVVTVDAPVLDLSHRSDLAAVKAALADVEVNL